MKTLAFLVCLFAAGTVASYAVATPPPGKGKPQSTTTSTTTTTHGTGHAGKVVLCHKTGSKTHPYVKMVVSKNALKAHLKRGDVMSLDDGSCPKPAVTTTATSTTTTGETTTTNLTATTTPAL